MRQDPAGRTISLVLGSGGARGLAHIGVIQWLNEMGFAIQSIAGSSMGALIGGIYAAGELDTYTNWVLELERIDVLRLLDFSFSTQALFKGERIIEVLRELIGDRNIEDLPIAYTAVATDVDTGKEVWLKEGPLFDAVRASIAIPTVFTPFSFRGRRLVDGGLVNPIPIAPTVNDMTDLTVAVNLSAKEEAEFNRRENKPLIQVRPGGKRERILKFIENLQTPVAQRDEPQANVFDIISKSLDTMQTTIARFKLASYSPDVIVEVPRNTCTFYVFHRAREMIEIGRSRAEAALARYAS